MKLIGLHVRWPLIVGAAVTGLAAYGAYLYRPKPALPTAPPRTSTNRVEKAAKHSSDSSAKQSKPAQVSYESAISGNLFNGPAPPEPKPAAPPAKPPVVIVAQAPPPDPLVDANFAGSATIDGQTAALIESRATHQGEYVFVGGSWQGHKVIEVAADHVLLIVNGVNRTLMASDEVNLVPLTASAPGSVANGQPTGPAQTSSGSTPQSDAKSSRMEMIMRYKSTMDAAKQTLELSNVELDLKRAQDKVQSLSYKKL